MAGWKGQYTFVNKKQRPLCSQAFAVTGSFPVAARRRAATGKEEMFFGVRYLGLRSLTHFDPGYKYVVLTGLWIWLAGLA